MYKAAAPRVFLQRSEGVEAAWLCSRLMQRWGRKGLDGEEVAWRDMQQGRRSWDTGRKVAVQSADDRDGVLCFEEGALTMQQKPN